MTKFVVTDLTEAQRIEALARPQRSWCACCHRYIETTAGFGVFFPPDADIAFYQRHGVEKIGYHLCALCSAVMAGGDKDKAQEVAEQIERYLRMSIETADD